MADDDVQIKFGVETSGADAGINHIGEKLKELGDPVREIAESFGLLRRTFVEAFAVDAVAEFVSHIADMGEEAIRTSEMLGISVEEVQKLGFAAQMVGGTSDTTATALTRLERNIAEAQDSTSKAARAFEALGISQDDIKNKSPAQVLGLIANAFAGAQDGAAKTAIAMDLMGRGGAQLIPLLNQGSEGLEKMGQTAEQAGVVLTTLQAEGLEKTAQGITTLKASVEGVGISIFETLKPAIDAAISGLTSLVQIFRATAEMIRVIADLIEGGLAVALAATIEKFEELGIRVANTFENIKIKVSEVASVLDELAHGHLQAAVNAQIAGEQKIAQSDAVAAERIKALGKEYDDLKTKIEGATQAALTFGTSEQKGEKTQLTAPTSGSGKQDDTETQIALDDIKTQEQLGKIGLATQKDLLEQELAAKQITKAQEFGISQEYLQLEYGVESDALQQKLELYSEDSREYAETLNQKKLLDAQYEQQLARLAAQGAEAQAAAAKKTAEQYKSVTDVIGRDFQGALQGVLTGTQSWQQAMGKAFSDLAASAVEAIAQIVAEWLVFEVLTEGQGTWSDFMALEKPGGGGLTSLLPSFDVGSYNVPSDMIAQIHQGEMIIPASQAAQIRSGTASGGSNGNAGNFTINVNAIDTQTGAQFLKNNASVIASAISGQVRNFNPSLRAN